ncbi:MAG: DUF177 domain-containing protein [Bryobacteraceae bacterium]
MLYLAFGPIQAPSEVCVFFSVQELEQRKIRFEVSLAPGEIEYIDKTLRQVGPLEAQGSAELLGNTLGEIRVRGHLKVTMEGDCGRCLEKAEFPIDSDFDLFYRPPQPVGHSEVEIREGEAEIGFYDGDGLQLNDILREYVILSLPMHLVCSEACLGICPVCGQNRNLRACGCEIKPVDDRWEALKRLQG